MRFFDPFVNELPDVCLPEVILVRIIRAGEPKENYL